MNRNIKIIQCYMKKKINRKRMKLRLLCKYRFHKEGETIMCMYCERRTDVKF